MVRLSGNVAQNLDKARSSILAAVEIYNKPSIAFRTQTYVILIVIGWTSLFHAIFYRRGRKPWYKASGTGRGTRYVKVAGEPKHWELRECLRQFFKDHNPPERSNIEFMLALRNKIEHRDHPELDPALYGECQAMLMNFEDLLVTEFGESFALTGGLSVALQFSALRPSEQEAALKRLKTSVATDILDFIRQFRSGLPLETSDSTKFALRVFLVPKLANRASAADLSVEFVQFDSSKPEEMKQLEQVAALIKAKRVSVARSGLLRPREVAQRLEKCLPFEVSMSTHSSMEIL